MMSMEEFLAKYRLQLRGMAISGFALRKVNISEMGLEHDVAMREIERILHSIWGDLHPSVTGIPESNGKHNALRKV